MEKNNVIISVIAVIIIIFLSSINSKLKNHIEESERDNQNIIQALENEINVLRFKIDDIKSDNQWINESSFRYVGLSKDESLIETEFTVSFQELYNSSRIYLIVTNVIDKADLIKFELKQVDDLIYQGSMGLDLNKNYTIDVIAESDILSKRETLQRLNVKNELSRRNAINERGVGYNRDNNLINLNYDFVLTNNHYGFDDFKLSNITVRIYKNSVLIDEFDAIDLMRKIDVDTQVTKYEYHGEITFEKGKKDTIFLELDVEDKLGMYTIEEILSVITS